MQFHNPKFESQEEYNCKCSWNSIQPRKMANPGRRFVQEGRSWVEVAKSRGKELGIVKDGTLDPLPKQIQLLREKCFSVFVFNVSKKTSKAEIEAMFCRVGKIVHLHPGGS